MTVPVPWGSTHLDRRTAGLDDVARESIGLYASLPVAHLELAARVPGYRTDDLDEAFEERRVIGLRCLRGSAFLMPVNLLSVVVAATRSRNARASGGYVGRVLVKDDYDTWAERIDDLLSDGVPRTKAEIREALDPPDEDREGLGYAIGQMATEARLVATRVPVSWRSSRNAYVRWQVWLPDVDVDVDEDEARIALAGLYLDAWGPATVDDFAWWSGLTKTQARSAIEASGAEPHGEWWRTGDLPVDDPPEGTRLLPIWDALFVTWKDRTRFLPDELRPFVYDDSGNATSVILHHGRPVGVWTMGGDDADLSVAVAPFGSFSEAQLHGIEREAGVVAHLSGSPSVRLVVCDEAPRLAGARRNLFMGPLRHALGE